MASVQENQQGPFSINLDTTSKIVRANRSRQNSTNTNDQNLLNRSLSTSSAPAAAAFAALSSAPGSVDSGFGLMGIIDRSDVSGHYMLQILIRPCYGETHLAPSLGKKLARLVNGIPFGPGRLPHCPSGPVSPAPQVEELNHHSPLWRHIDGLAGYTFLSPALSTEDAQETHARVRAALRAFSKELFGDVAVRCSLILTRCVDVDAEFFLNDIADVKNDSSLYFHD